jgi:type II secretion system protein J
MPRTQPPRRDGILAEQGFTLLEVLIALAILATIMVILFGTYAASVERAERTRNLAEVYHEARILLDLMANDIRASYLPEADVQPPPPLKQPKSRRYNFVGEDLEEAKLPADKLTFFALLPPLHPDTPEAEVCRVMYSLEPTASPARERILIRRVNCSLDPEASEQEHVFPLTESVAGLDFKYYDDQGHEELEWDSRNGSHGKSLPARVKIVLLLADRRGSLHPFELLTELALAR